MWRYIFQASLRNGDLPFQRLMLNRLQPEGFVKVESPGVNIQARLASTSKTITSDITKQDGFDNEGKVQKRKTNRIVSGDEDKRQMSPARQKKPRKNSLMTQYALDIVSNRDTNRRSDLSIRKKSKYLIHGRSTSERTKDDFQYTRSKNIQRSEDDGFGFEGFEDIVGLDTDDDDDGGYDVADKDGDTASKNFFRAYKLKFPIGFFMIKANGYNNSCKAKVLENRTKYYNSETDDASVSQLADSLTKVHNIPLDILTEGVKSLCRIPGDKLDAIVGLHLPYSLPKAACTLVGKLTSDSLGDILLAMSRLHCKLSSDDVKVLEKECLKHLNLWDLKTMLLVSDCWLHLSPDVKLSYHQKMVELVTDDVYYGTELTEQDVVQLFYIMRLSKTCTQIRGVYSKLLRIVTNSLDSLTWAEVANICFAVVKLNFFKEEQNKNFFSALSQKFTDGLRNKEIDMYCTTGIMRCLARCYHEDVETFDALAEYLTPIIQSGGKGDDTRVNYMQLHIGHIAMAFSKVRMFHKPLMDSIVDYILYSESRHRTKDVNLLLWAFGRLHYKPEENCDRFFQQLVQLLRFKETSREMFPETFLGSLVSLTFLGYYPEVLINQVFSPAYLQVCEEHMRKAGLDPLCRHLFTLDCSVALECPDYDGNRLPERIIQMYKDVRHGSKWHLQRMETYGRCGEITGLLREMLGHQDHVKIRPILPHIKTPADIEVHLDSQGKPIMPHSCPSDDRLGYNLTNVSIPYYKLDEFMKETLETSKASGIHRIAVLVNSPLHYHCNSQQLLGAHVMKRRQLRKVGYKIVEIPHFEWSPLRKESRRAKTNYLKNKLEDAIRPEKMG